MLIPDNVNYCKANHSEKYGDPLFFRTNFPPFSDTGADQGDACPHKSIIKKINWFYFHHANIA